LLAAEHLVVGSVELSFFHLPLFRGQELSMDPLCFQEPPAFFVEGEGVDELVEVAHGVVFKLVILVLRILH